MTMIFLILIPIACNGYLSNAESDTPTIEVADKQNVQQEGTAQDPIDHNSLAPPVEKDMTDVEKQKPDTEEKQAEPERNIAVTEKIKPERILRPLAILSFWMRHHFW